MATIYTEVDEDFHQRARIQAIREKRSLSALVREAVEHYLAGIEEPEEGKAKATA